MPAHQERTCEGVDEGGFEVDKETNVEGSPWMIGAYWTSG